MALDFNNDPRQATFEDAALRKARIEKALQARIREFVRYLYPKAIFNARDARIGDTSGARGESMSISITSDDSAGRWIDHANGEKGDVFTLYARAHNLDAQRDFAQVLTECDQWSGGSPAPRAEARHRVEAAKPAEPRTKRTKTLETAYVYRTKEGQEWGFEQRRYRYTDTGEKTYLPFWNGNPGMPPENRPLYNLNRWHAEAAVIVVEGEKCADALTAIGIHATTLMGGANTTITKTDLTPLAGKDVILWPDHDAPGLKLMNDLAGPLRAMGCQVRILTPPSSKPEKWDAADAVAEGFDVIGFLKAPSEPERAGQTILHELWPDIRFTYEPELVEELFPRIGLGTIYGPSTAGKTFVTLDWMAAIATGAPLYGRDTEAVGVLYLAFEGFYGIKKRIHGIKQEKGLSAVALELVDAPWTLSEPQDWQAMRAHIEAAKERLDETGYPLGIIVVDTLTAAYAGIDANSQGEVTKAMRQLKRLAMDLQCLVLVIGHTGKDTTRGMVGSFAYKSESDTFIELRTERDEADDSVKRRSIYIEKVKDGPSDFTLSDYALIEVRIGTKPNGKPITTCIVEWVQPAKKKGANVYSGTYLAIVEALNSGPMTVVEVAAKIGVERSNAFKKLRNLEQDGAVFARMDGTRSVWVLCNDGLHSEN